jgi:tartrate-resistant acid phosphatase type 5
MFTRPFAWVTVLGFLVVGCSDDANTPRGGGGQTSIGPGSGGVPTTGNLGGSPANTNTGSGAGTNVGGGGAGVGGAGGSGGSEPAGLVRFVAIGDAGKGNDGQLAVGNAIAAKCALSGCDFVQLLGDNIYDSGAESATDPIFMSKFETPYAAVDLPFWVVLGNHDYGGDGTGFDIEWGFDKAQNEIDYTQNSTKWKLPASYYHHSISHTEFFAFNSNMWMFDQAGDQATDFPQWMNASTATWKIGFGHHPYLSNGDHGNAGNYEGLSFIPVVNGQGVKDFMEGIVCGNVDVYISGHDHSMQWLSDTCGGTELILSGAGATTTELGGDNGYYFEALQIGFLYVRIEGNSFTGEFYDEAGTMLFTRTITK